MDIILYHDDKALSVNELGFCLYERIQFPISKKKIKKIDVVGREGSLTVEEGFENLEIEMSLNGIFNSLEEAEAKTRCLIDKLERLEQVLFLEKKDRYVRVKYVEYSEVQSLIPEHKKFEIKLICEPFYYKNRTDEFYCFDSNNSKIKFVNEGVDTAYKFKIFSKTRNTVDFFIKINGQIKLEKTISYNPKIGNNVQYLLVDFINGIEEQQNLHDVKFNILELAEYNNFSKIKHNDVVEIVLDGQFDEFCFYIDEKYIY